MPIRRDPISVRDMVSLYLYLILREPLHNSGGHTDGKSC